MDDNLIKHIPVGTFTGLDKLYVVILSNNVGLQLLLLPAACVCGDVCWQGARLAAIPSLVSFQCIFCVPRILQDLTKLDVALFRPLPTLSIMYVNGQGGAVLQRVV